MARTVVAITGASSGIGEVFARKLALTHDLLLIARRKDRLEALAAEFKMSAGTEVEVLAADLAEPDEQRRVAERLGNEKRLLLLVNNAGFGSTGRFWEASLESQEKMHQVHVMATMRLTYAALNNLVPRDTGGIINVSSVSAYVRVPGSVSYGATKTWINAFTEGLALELKGMGSPVVVQALCPGYTYSDFQKTMGVQEAGFKGGPMWMSAEYVVEQSLEGLRSGRLFVIPGWRYRLITALLSKLPSALRVQVEGAVGKSKEATVRLQKASGKSIE